MKQHLIDQKYRTLEGINYMLFLYQTRLNAATDPESIEILERYGADYIVVFVTYNPNNIQNQWPFGDNAKWEWMVNIGGLDLNDYVNYTAGVYKDGYLNSTLVKLMYQVPPFDVFDPVYVSEHGFVVVYKINYPE